MIRAGTTLGGYQVEAAIGQGGMAAVYRARRLRDGQTAALKILREQYAADAEFVERFQREARAVASLTHPNMVQVYESGEADGVHFIAMEFVEGQDLKRRLRESGGPLEVAEAVRIGVQVCEVLDYAHRRGIIHRDIKPQNILLTADGVVKVTDFGIARALSAVTITQTGTVLGSVQYLSPEAARGQPTGRAADIYALAVVLFEMVTGALPFDGDSPIAVALKHLHEVPPAPSALNPEVPAALEAVILRGMAKSPRHRYPTAGDLATDLLGQTSFWREGMLEPEPVEATRVLRPGGAEAGRAPGGATLRETLITLWQRVRLSRTLGPALAVMIVALLTGGVWGAWRSVTSYYTVAEVDVPKLVGLPVAEAETVARRAGVGLNTEARGYSDTVPAGSIISQDQAPGKRVKGGRVITVVVSQGREQVAVPEVVGQPLPSARLVIENARLRVGRVDERFDQAVRAGLIMTQDPPAGSRASRGSAVTLLVSRGPELVEMPVLVGRSLAEARERLEELGLIVRQVRSAVSPDVPPGTVVDQTPAPGRRIKPAQTEVTLTVSVRPGAEQNPPQVPVVTGERQTPPTPPVAPGPTPRGEERARGDLRTAVHVVVPEGAAGQRVRIIVIDESGVRTVYERSHNPGERIDLVVQSRGYTIIQVYINAVLVQEIRP
ncbi:MAG: Stk1 family PASTA domain-containing Ser/Thr kinase [Armatimonadetes bacterium]|nr:Stk1 family PASTA domain-containing Ser/Thr kinase [Armatimonadota bacterium]